ncbi:MAG TPA: protein kinase, partial [Gemmatimonadaceae bacterium]
MTTISQLSAALGSRYRIERELGAGGMATVFLAHDLKHDRPVALKVLRPELAAVLGTERFLQEIRIAARLDHPHILTLIDSGAADGVLYYVLPYVRGESLREALTREKQLTIDEAVAIARQVGSALEYAHRQGVVHRDIKPENILLQEGEAMLTDFGIALAVREAGGNRLTETGTSLGTPQYMSPEQATGDRQLDARSDVYSLGAVLYEMLTGEPPHTGATVQAVIAKLLTERPTSVRLLRDTVPEGLDRAVTKALAKVPADRHRSAGDFVAALSAVSSVTARPWPRSRSIAITGSAAVVALVALGVWLRRPKAANAPIGYDRIQLTTSGQASSPVLSPDGAQMAYSTRTCTDDGTCRVSIIVRDLASNVERSILDSLDWGGPEHWSADGLWLLVSGHPVGKPFGTYLVSRLGGPLIFAGLGDGDFMPNGDTVLVAPGFSATQTIRLRLVPVPAAQPADSMAIESPRGANWLANVRVAPNGRWVGALWTRAGGPGTIAIYDRRGGLIDSTSAPNALKDGLKWDPASSAVYAPVQSAGGQGALLHIVVRATSGKLGAQDTVTVSGDQLLPGFDLSSNGRALAYTSYRSGEYTMWTLEQRVAGEPPRPLRRVRSASAPFGFYLSKDGRHIFFAAPVTGGAESQVQLFVEPFDSATARPVTPPLAGVTFWNPTLDGRRLIVETNEPGGRARLTAYDIATGRASVFADMPARGNIWEAGPDGIVMVDESLDTLRVLDGAGRERRRIGIPDSVGLVVAFASSPDGTEFLFPARPRGTESDEKGERAYGLYRVSA